MSRSHIGQRIALGLALGLISLLPTISRATTIPAPFKSWAATSIIPSTSYVGSASIAHTGSVPGATFLGTFDLANNDVIIHSTNETDAVNTFNLISDAVRSGWNFPSGGDESGKGIQSTTANFDFNNGDGITGVGVMLNDQGDQSNPDGSGTPFTTTWDGYAVDQYDVMVKYTFLGDTTLRGIVTGSDYSTALAFYQQGVYGWQNGDFAFQGNTSGGDVSSVLTAIGAQGDYPIIVGPAQPGSGGGASLAVPEPSTLLSLLIGVGAAGGLMASGRRLKKSKSAT